MSGFVGTYDDGVTLFWHNWLTTYLYPWLDSDPVEALAFLERWLTLYPALAVPWLSQWQGHSQSTPNENEKRLAEVLAKHQDVYQRWRARDWPLPKWRERGWSVPRWRAAAGLRTTPQQSRHGHAVVEPWAEYGLA